MSQEQNFIDEDISFGLLLHYIYLNCITLFLKRLSVLKFNYLVQKISCIRIAILKVVFLEENIKYIIYYHKLIL